MAGQEPNVPSLGVAYMLAGGSDPSNTDPMAMAPLPGEDWVTTPPHMMILTPGGLTPADFTTDHTSGEPYIMWEGTPYEHLMVPVADMEHGDVSEMGQSGPVSPGDSVEAQIANAMSAGPAAVGRDATVLGWDESGMPTVVLREGTGEWTCLADWPASPGNDPQCFDPIWTAWNDAYMAGQEPNVPSLGVAYMLAGGSDPSNTDPMAMAPLPGEDWVTTPPHMMILTPGGLAPADFTTDHTSGEPYIMWEGTPYEHLMVPVADMEESHSHD